MLQVILTMNDYIKQLESQIENLQEKLTVAEETLTTLNLKWSPPFDKDGWSAIQLASMTPNNEITFVFAHISGPCPIKLPDVVMYKVQYSVWTKEIQIEHITSNPSTEAFERIKAEVHAKVVSMLLPK